jgi:hypothetical protein
MLAPEHRKLLIIEQGIAALVINVLLNGGIAYLLFRSMAKVPLWGDSSAGGDLLITAVLLPLLTCLIVSRIIGKQVRDGKLPPLPTRLIPASGWSHRPTLQRGLFLGSCALLLAALPVVAALSLANSASFEAMSFVGYKALWAGLLAGAVSPIIAWWALADASRTHSSQTTHESTHQATRPITQPATSPTSSEIVRETIGAP